MRLRDALYIESRNLLCDFFSFFFDDERSSEDERRAHR